MTLISLQRLAPRPLFEAIVVCNLESDPSLEELPQKFPNVQFLCSGQLGASRARNQAARSAKGEFLLFLSDDVRLHDPHLLQKYESSFALNSDASLIGGAYIENNSEFLYQAYASIRDNRQNSSSINEHSQSLGLLSGNFCVRREVFDCGLHFDEVILENGAESEFATRLYRLGYKIYFDPELKVLHFGSNKNILKKLFYKGYGEAKMLDSGANLSLSHNQRSAGDLFSLLLQFVAEIGNLKYQYEALNLKTNSKILGKVFFFLRVPLKMIIGIFPRIFRWSVPATWTPIFLKHALPLRAKIWRLSNAQFDRNLLPTVKSHGPKNLST